MEEEIVLPKWSVKVEYQVDKTESVVDSTWILDFAECPVYDPHRTYRGFWSSVLEDTPDAMLGRVPQIPCLTEEQEKKSMPGYYRICILGVEDDPEKFKLSRVRKNTQRGKKPEENQSRQKKGRKSAKKPGSSSSTTDKNKSDSKAEHEAKKTRASRANLGLVERSQAFDNVDAGNCKNQEEDSGSDDSTSDQSVVSSAQMKVLQTSIKNLKARLLEKCKEVTELQSKLASKDLELEKLRAVNLQLQEKVLDAVPSFLLSRRMSVSSSRSSSLASSRASSYERIPACPRSRTASGSSISSSSSRHHEQVTPTSNKRKTPPSSPFLNAKKSFSSNFLTNLSSPSENRPGPLSARSSTTNRAETPRKSSEELTPKLSTELESDSLSLNGNDENLSSPLRQHSSSIDTSSVTITNSTDHENSFNAEDYGGPADKPSENKIASETRDITVPEGQVQFCPGFFVDESKLKLIDSRAKARTEDGTYVKELAILVFGHKTLYNSSLKERKYNAKDEEQDENKKPRKMLDLIAVEAIRKKLEIRVYEEYDQKVPSDGMERFTKAKVNRYIYEKVKKLRSNPKMHQLIEASGTSSIVGNPDADKGK